MSSASALNACKRLSSKGNAERSSVAPASAASKRTSKPPLASAGPASAQNMPSSSGDKAVKGTCAVKVPALPLGGPSRLAGGTCRPAGGKCGSAGGTCGSAGGTCGSAGGTCGSAGGTCGSGGGLCRSAGGACGSGGGMCGSGGGTRVSGGGTSVSAGGLCRSAGGTCRSAEGTCGSGGGTRAHNSSASGATWGAVGAMAGTAKATAVSNPGRQEDGSGSTDCRGAEKMREGAENTWHKESEMPSRGGNNGGSEGEGGNEVLDAEEGWAKEEVDDDSLAVIRDEASVKFGDAAGECNPLRHKKVARSSSKGALQRSSSRRLVRQKSANVPSLKRSSTQKVVNVPSTPPNRTLRRSLTVGADVEPTGHIAPLFARGRRTDWGDDAEGKAAGEKMTGPQQRALRPAEKSYALVPTVEALEDLRKLLPLLAASLMLNRKEQLPEGHATHFVESFFFNKVKRAGGSAQWRRPVERIEELTRALKTGVQRGMSPSGQRGAGEEEQRPSFGGASNKDVSVYKRTHINYDLVRHLITGEEEAPLINEHDELPRNPGAGPSTTYLPRQGSSTSNLLSAHPVCPPKQLVAAVAYPCPTLPFAVNAKGRPSSRSQKSVMGGGVAPAYCRSEVQAALSRSQIKASGLETHGVGAIQERTPAALALGSEPLAEGLDGGKLDSSAQPPQVELNDETKREAPPNQPLLLASAGAPPYATGVHRLLACLFDKGMK